MTLALGPTPDFDPAIKLKLHSLLSESLDLDQGMIQLALRNWKICCLHCSLHMSLTAQFLLICTIYLLLGVYTKLVFL